MDGATPGIYGQDKEMMRKMEMERKMVEDHLAKVGDSEVAETARKKVSMGEEQKKASRDEWNAAERLYESARELFQTGDLPLNEAISQLSESLGMLAKGKAAPEEEEEKPARMNEEESEEEESEEPEKPEEPEEEEEKEYKA